jgi:hypothetical protein
MLNCKLIRTCGLLLLFGMSTLAQARISIEPFATVSSKKEIKPNKAGKKTASGGAATETEVVKQRTTYGLRGSLGFFRLMKLQAGIGTNELITTSKTSQAADDYGEIDYEKDLDMDTSTPDKEVKLTETQRKGSAVLVIDPGFWIFILRAKAGVIATQRAMTKEVEGEPAVKFVSPITYKPTVGGGAGIKLSSSTFFMAEYSLFLYKFPKKAPFEREVTVSFGVSL